jgi:phosphatidylethanolamine/phosphatidyl-N-methylethanolamine N-methyltransferase
MTDFAEHRVFLHRALRRPSRLGAPAPTGPALAARVAGAIPRTGRPTVVELGAGTGPLSRAIAARLPAGSRYVAVELDPELVTHLRRTQPGLEVLPGDAADLGALLGAADVGPADVVVSSLPWTLVPVARRRAMLAGIARSMAPTGTFLTISTLTALPDRVRALRADLAGAFGRVRATPPVWRNVPPSRLLVGREPRVR